MKSRGLYTKTNDEGQDCISLGLVIKSKIINDKPGTKACLCAREFKEEQNFRTVSHFFEGRGDSCLS